MGRKRYKRQEIVAKLRRACGDRHRLEAADVFARSLATADLIQCLENNVVSLLDEARKAI